MSNVLTRLAEVLKALGERLNPVPKVENIFKNVEVQIVKLEQAAERHLEEVAKHDLAIAEAKAKQLASQFQIDRAKTVASNLKTLIGKL
jgi:predicted transcriptional regulator